MTKRLARAALLVALGAVLAACSFFGPDRPKPKVLAPIASPIAVQAVWKQGIGAIRFPLTVAVNGNVATLATSGGEIVALDVASGRTIWRADVGARISAGVGSDGKTSAVVTRDGNLVAVRDGRVVWTRPLGVRVATAPLVAGERVFVLSVDRAVRAFDAGDGSSLWQLQRPGEALTLAQTGVLAAFKNTLLVGQGPRLAGVDPVAATVKWEVPIGSPRGTNEVERLADLIGPVLRNGDLVCARSFQAGVGCVNAERGDPVWTKAFGGSDPIGGDSDMVFAADAADRLTAWKADSGDVVWTSEALMFHRLGGAAAIGGSVVFGDEAGMLHWMSRGKGDPQLHLQVDGSAIDVPPVVAAGVLIVVTRSGGVFAYRPA